MSIANEIFPIPKPKSKSTKKRNDEYFVITADEILNQKRKAIELKVRQAEAREQKRNEREKKRAEKAIKLAGKKRGAVRGEIKKADLW